RRPTHTGRNPVHATLRKRSEIVSLRRHSVCGAVKGALHAASHDGFAVMQYSIQIDHIHLIIEATDQVTFSRGMRGLAIRVAKAINRALARRGRVWDDRYHARDLATPRDLGRRHELPFRSENGNVRL